MSAVEFTVRDHSNWQISMDVTGAPDTTNPEVPSLGTVRPNALGVGLFPHTETGAWEVSSVGVVGPKVRDGQVATKRDYTVTFMEPLGPDSVAPEWVREIAQEWTDRANGGAEKPVSSVEISRRVRRSPQRASFDMALNVLLIRENLDGTEWAIQWLMERADAMPDVLPDSAHAEFLKLTAYSLRDALDKRAAELATREQ
ncbi:hypothetical protein [Streptomyces sp. NPDC091879]|uniref:hypothetical protein n=1 Tax=Streptomyces sp. NPDC091879 TaxID=3366006 RepID=UPI00382825E4